MSTSVAEKAVKAWHEKGRINIKLSSGRTVSFPVSANARLSRGTAAQLNRIEISPYGLHWPELDEDLSTAGILAGRYGDAPSGSRKKNGVHVRLYLSVSPECREKVVRFAKKRKVGLSQAAEELIAGA